MSLIRALNIMGKNEFEKIGNPQETQLQGTCTHRK